MELSSVGRVIVGALRRGPRSGYEIKHLVDRSTRFFWAASYGQIYPELHRLEAEGLIAGTSKPQGARPRNVYRLTPRGRRALRAWLRSPEAGYEVRDEGLLKLFFADALSQREALALVRNFRANRQFVLDRLLEIRRDKGAQRPQYPSLVLEYGIELHRWEVNWLERVERRIAAELEEAA
jgi:PadR family transcriptional regulator AphA